MDYLDKKEGGDVTAGYAQLLRVVGWPLKQGLNLVASSSSSENGNMAELIGQQAKLPSDHNIPRDAIFTDVFYLNERYKRKYSIILQRFD